MFSQLARKGKRGPRQIDTARPETAHGRWSIDRKLAQHKGASPCAESRSYTRRHGRPINEGGKSANETPHLPGRGGLGPPRAFAAGAQTGESPVPRPLSVLFFGDRGHHRSADRYEQIAPVLAGRGIEVTYTENVSDLNPASLKKYRAADLRQHDPDQQGSGEGAAGLRRQRRRLVPLHCASFCFLNSPEYIALVGAQFQKHGTGEFETTVVDPNHPIIKGLEPFRTWDETYVHTKHNTKDRHVLQTRNDQSGSEPWTWTRAHGNGPSLHRIRPRRPHLGPPRLP